MGPWDLAILVISAFLFILGVFDNALFCISGLLLSIWPISRLFAYRYLSRIAIPYLFVVALILFVLSWRIGFGIFFVPGVYSLLLLLSTSLVRTKRWIEESLTPEVLWERIDKALLGVGIGTGLGFLVFLIYLYPEIARIMEGSFEIWSEEDEAVFEILLYVVYWVFIVVLASPLAYFTIIRNLVGKRNFGRDFEELKKRKAETPTRAARFFIALAKKYSNNNRR